MTVHGGRLIAAQRRWPGAPAPWIDLSTGINPFPYPVPTLLPEVWTRLPEPEEEAALISAAAEAYGVEPDRVVAAPGTSALIALLPRVLAGDAAVLGPTYGEYARAWPGAIEVATLQALRTRPVRVMCRPNNPDGRCDAAAEVLDLARDGVLVLDEAFADFGGSVPGARPPHPTIDRLCRSIPRGEEEGGLVVLKSFGKTFGLAGLRLGFAIAPANIAARLRHALGPWPVSGPAIAIGTRALRDRSWLAEARARSSADAARLDALLHDAGLDVVGGTSLFRLVDCDAPAWHDRLGRAGILTRAFPDHPRWLRFGLPAEWDRLERALHPGE